MRISYTAVDGALGCALPRQGSLQMVLNYVFVLPPADLLTVDN